MMSKTLFPIFLCCASAVSIGAIAQAKPKPNNPHIDVSTIKGTVAGRGAPVSNAKVVAKNTATQDSRSVTTNSHGDFIFEQIPDANYQVTASAQGFDDQTIPVELRDEPSTIHFVLKSRLDTFLKGRITIRVVDYTANPDRNMQIEIENAKTRVKIKGIIGSTGEFSADNLAAGSYTVTVFGKPSQQVTLAEDQQIVVNFN
jgi:hypothetical protein